MNASNRYVPAGATVIEDTVVEARQPWSGRVDAGEHLVLVDLEGQQAVDFLCYNAHDPQERYHAPNTIKLQHNIYLGEGSVLWSVRGRPMMTMVEDTCGGHDTIFGCCSFELDDVRYGRRNPRACQQNFEQELARHGLDATAVVPNINFFMRVPVDADGSVDIVDGWSNPGDHVTLRAEMDVLVVISNCPEALNPLPAGIRRRCGRSGIETRDATGYERPRPNSARERTRAAATARSGSRMMKLHATPAPPSKRRRLMTGALKVFWQPH